MNLVLDIGRLNKSPFPAALLTPKGRRPFDVGVVYGGSSARGQPLLLKEVAFSDSQALTMNRFERWHGRARAALSLNSNIGFQLPIMGAVVAVNVNARLPHDWKRCCWAHRCRLPRPVRCPKSPDTRHSL